MLWGLFCTERFAVYNCTIFGTEKVVDWSRALVLGNTFEVYMANNGPGQSIRAPSNFLLLQGTHSVNSLRQAADSLKNDVFIRSFWAEHFVCFIAFMTNFFRSAHPKACMCDLKLNGNKCFDCVLLTYSPLVYIDVHSVKCCGSSPTVPPPSLSENTAISFNVVLGRGGRWGGADVFLKWSLNTGGTYPTFHGINLESGDQKPLERRPVAPAF